MAARVRGWEIAWATRLSESTLSRIVSGRRDVTDEEARLIATALGREVHELFPELGEAA